jgi:RNA polymerase sigma factor (sigma-70 family)
METHRAQAPTGSVTQLIHRFQSGDPVQRDEAARQIWERYLPRLLTLARRHLDRRIRAREDEEDVVLSAGKSVFNRVQRGDFDLAGRDALWALLVRVVKNKACNAADRHYCDKRNARLERPFAPSDVDSSDAPHGSSEPVEDTEPTPAEAALRDEALEQRLRTLPERDLREIALLKLEGYTNGEIGDKLKCSERGIERKLNLIRKRWEEVVEDLA